MYPMLDDQRFISQVWSFEDLEAVEFIQLNVFGPDLINYLLIGLTGAAAVHGGAINPLLDGRVANALDARDGFRMHPFKILVGLLLINSSIFKLVEGHALSIVSKISYGVTSAKRQRVFSNAI